MVGRSSDSDSKQAMRHEVQGRREREREGLGGATNVPD